MAGGRVLAFLTILALPVLGFAVGLFEHAEVAKRTEFCVSCHVMEPYGRSLLVDSADHLPAQHFQNARVSQNEACYVCHTNYAMFGDLQSKLVGVRHVLVNYLGTVPDEVALYEPYQNRECLYCHGGARYFEELDFHIDMRAEMETNEISCLECHDLSHDVGHLDSLDMWEGSQ